jgi:ribose/xylose/arabinose/galactoside ABC-type transport system permease subunit
MIKNNTNKTGYSIGGLLLRGKTLIALIVLLVIFSFASPSFFTLSSGITVAKHASLYSLLAIGMTFVIISGGIDLSVGSVVGITGMIAGWMINKGIDLPMFGMKIYFSIPVIAAIVIVIGGVIGCINGIIISKFKVPPFITTLGTMNIARGFSQLISGGGTFPNLVGKEELNNMGFRFLGGGSMLGIPTQIWIMAIFALIATYVLKKTTLGLHIYSVGGNEKAAKFSGVRVNNVKVIVYCISGVCAAMAGLIATSQLVAAHPATGEGWETNAISAAVLGGTSMSGGIGTIWGSIVGAFVIGVLADGMTMVGISEFWQKVIKGAVIILAVILDTWQNQMNAKLAVQNRKSSDK